MDLKRSALAFLMMFQSIALFSNNRIFFHNNYNGSIAVQVNDRPEVIVPYNTRVFLGTIRLDNRVPLAFVKSIKIRATGIWSAYDRTPYTLLDKNLLDIQWQKKLHCSNSNNPECADDAVLVVNPSSMLSNWNVSLHWEKTVPKVETFEMSDFSDKALLNELKVLVQKEKYDQVVAFFARYGNQLKNIFSSGQINAITVGSKNNADPHQKEAAIKFVNAGLAKAT